MVVVAVALLLHPLRRQLEVVVVATLDGVVAVALLLRRLLLLLEEVVVVAGVLDGVVATILVVAGVASLKVTMGLAPRAALGSRSWILDARRAASAGRRARLPGTGTGSSSYY